jgi:predicted acetyltransferase
MEVPDRFEFGYVESDEELEEFLKFQSLVHPDDDVEELRRQIEFLPAFTREMNYYIRDLDTGQIVTALNAIPSIWNYEDIPLKNLELGWVGTLKEYRRKGLSRVLYTHFDSLLTGGDYDLSTIMGIPYFYRQFGYDFVLPMNRTIWIRLDQIKPLDKTDPPEYMNFKIRPATHDDIPSLMTLFREHNKRLLVHVDRDQGLWEIQEKERREFEESFQTYILEDSTGIIGYFRLVKSIRKEPTKSTFRVIESRIRTYDGALRVLKFLRAAGANDGIDLFGIQGPSTNNLARVAHSLGGTVNKGWKYQIRIPDILHFLKKIRPVLERRLLGSMFEDLTRDFTINTFRHCFLLKFSNGKILDISDLGPPEVNEYLSFRAPPLDLVRLMLGAYSIDELESNNIDFIVRGGVKLLVETLFPKKESAIYYYYC